MSVSVGKTISWEARVVANLVATAPADPAVSLGVSTRAACSCGELEERTQTDNWVGRVVGPASWYAGFGCAADPQLAIDGYLSLAESDVQFCIPLDARGYAVGTDDAAVVGQVYERSVHSDVR